MNFIIFLLCFYDWFYNGYNQTLVEEARYWEYTAGKTRIDTSSNPFYYFFKGIEYERKGFFMESVENLKKSLELSDDNIHRIIRFYIISIDKDIKTFEEELKRKLIFLREKNEWDGLYFFSDYLLLRSKHTIGSEKKEFLIKESILFSPDFYPAYIELVKLHMEDFKVFKAIGDLSDFIGLLFKSSFLRKFVILIFIKSFFLLFSYFLIFFVLGKILSFSRYETYYIKRFFRTSFPFLLIIDIIFILFSVPSSYHLLLLLPFFAFFTRKEKFLFLVLALIITSIFYFGSVERNIENYYSEQNYPLTFMRIKNIPFSKKVFNSMKKDNPFEANVKGIMLVRKGEYDSAFNYFKNLSKEHPDDPYVLINIGNLFYLKGNYDSAYIYYRKSVSLNEDSFESHFNIAQIGFKKMDIPLYENEISRAQNADYAEVSKKTFRIKEYGAEELFWGIPPFKEKKISTRSEIEKLYGFPLSGIFAFFLLIFSVFLFPKHRKPIHCSLCGKFSNEIFKIETSFEVCRKCAKEILKTESLKIRERIGDKIKVDAIERKRFVTFILNILIPPLGFLYAGSHFFFTFAFIFLFIGFYTGISLKIHLLWIGFYVIYLIIFVFPFYYFKEVKIGTSG